MKRTFRYIKVHENMPDHPKVEPLSDAAFRLLVAGWCWSRKYGTDGLMPLSVWSRRKTTRVRDELVTAGLVHVEQGGVRFHDYLDWQQSADDLESARQQRVTAGRAGGLAKAKRAASDSLSEPPSESLSETASGSVPEGEGEGELGTTSLVGRRKRTTATAAPDTFQITEQLRAWGRQHAPLVTDPEVETRQFLDHHRAKGSTFKDWTAAWRTWMGNAQKYAERTTRPTGSPTSRPAFAVGYRDSDDHGPSRVLTAEEWANENRSAG